MSYSLRHEGLNSLETKEVNDVEETISALLISIGILRTEKRQARRKYRKLVKNLCKFCGILANIYTSKTVFYVSNVLGPKRRRRTINSFSSKECWRRFRFRKRDLKRLLVVFGLDEVEATLGTDGKRGDFSGEEIVLYSLYRLASTTSHGECETLFDTDGSNLSAMYNWFISYMYNNFGHLVTDNIPYWSERFPVFSEAVRTKFTARTGLDIMVGNFKIVAFHDCTVIGCCRPGGGPSSAGQNAPRYNNFIQMAFYNGWKHMHGTKWLTVELPNGMCMDMHGPFSFRHNDLELFEDARLNDRLEAAQVDQENRYCSYGDSIFPNLTCCKSKHRANALTQEEQLQNAGMGSMRIANEWHYGFTANLFPRVKHKSSLKILQSQNVSLMYLVCTLLRNARTCLYGSQTCRYFDCLPPTLENYFSQGAVNN
jgi:hypothetical protein